MISELAQQTSDAPSSKTAQFFAAYFWFILKNVIGWVLVLTAPVIGIVLPGPGGLPLFLIGFALVTLPGKRRLTARALRGRQLQLQSSIFYGIGTVVSLLVPAIGLWILNTPRFKWLIEWHILSAAVIVGLCVLAAAISWLLTRLTLRFFNVLLLLIARGRRSLRPWLRRRGIRLLPARRHRRAGMADENEILEIHERHLHRARWIWKNARPWLRRTAGLSVAIAAWVWILDPLFAHWPRVSGVSWDISWMRLLAAVAILTGFLAVFRALVWRHTLLSLGVSMPVVAALRIWCSIELARYIPGGFFSLAGRINLARPYGLDMAICTASHAIELAVFFLANIIVAAAGLIWFAASVLDSNAMIVYGALALLPLLLMTLHPSVFYRALNWICRGLGLGTLDTRLAGAELLQLLGWMLLGLGVQMLAIWMLFGQSDTFSLSGRHLPLLAAAYSLAWCIGAAAIWVPAGLGVTELVFVKILALSPLGYLGPMFSDSLSYYAMLALMSIVLRLWSTAGDVLLAAFAFGMEIYSGPRINQAAPAATEAS